MIDLIPGSDAIFKILSVDFFGKLKANSDSSSKLCKNPNFHKYNLLSSRFTGILKL